MRRSIKGSISNNNSKSRVALPLNNPPYPFWPMLEIHLVLEFVFHHTHNRSQLQQRNESCSNMFSVVHLTLDGVNGKWRWRRNLCQIYSGNNKLRRQSSEFNDNNAVIYDRYLRCHFWMTPYVHNTEHVASHKASLHHTSAHRHHSPTIPFLTPAQTDPTTAKTWII